MMPVCPRSCLAGLYRSACKSEVSGGAEEINQLSRAITNRQEKASAAPEEERLYLLLAPLILRESKKYCQKEPGCELDCLLGDLHDEAYLSLLDLLDTWDPERADFLGYASRYLPKRMARAHRRMELRVGSFTRVDLPQADLLVAPSGNLERVRSAHRTITWLLSSLPTDDRDLIRRRYFLEQSWEEIGEARGLSPTAVKKKCWRIMRRLHRRLSEQPWVGT
jgi:RNA polymerase sigma factor (sigma-70 family)